MQQLTLFGEIEEREEYINKYDLKGHSKVRQDRLIEKYKDMEKHNRKVTEKEAEKNCIMFPCPLAQQFPIGETRNRHIKHCPDCQKLLQRLDEIAYGNNSPKRGWEK